MTRGPAPTFLKNALFVTLFFIGVWLGWQGVRVVTDDPGFVHHARSPALPGEFRGRAILHGSDSHPPLCIAVHEHFEECGKTKCWVPVGTLHVAQGRADLDDGTAITLGRSFTVEPANPVFEHGTATSRLTELQTIGTSTIGFDATSFATDGAHRVREWCARELDTVWIAACEENRTTIPCAGQSSWVVALGDGTPDAAVGAYMDGAIAWFAAAAVVLSLALLTRLTRRSPIARALARRATKDELESPVATVLPGLFAIGLFGLALALVVPDIMRASVDDPSSREAYGRSGEIVMAISAAIILAGAIAILWRRSAVARACRVVAATAKRSLGNAQGTAALFVRAERSEGIHALVDGAPVAFSRAVLSERHGGGKSTRVTLIAGPHDAPEQIAVTDASGAGTVYLGRAALDVEKKSMESVGLPKNVRARFGDPAPKEAHSAWIVEEERIGVGEELLVFGEVTSTTLRAGDAGYRTTERSPTLGGPESPVVVYAGKHVELDRELRAERRAATIVVALVLALLAGLVVATNVLQHW